MTTTGRAKLRLIVAEKDMKNLQNVFDIAESLSKKGGEQESEDNTERAAALFVNRKDLKSTRTVVFGSTD
eukprot:2764575-Lingulodinium_polyedra.AAC.1